MTYVEDLFSLQGRVAMVTGGYGHLGRAMCCALAAAGATVYCAGPSKERFLQSFATIKNSGIHFLPLDLLRDNLEFCSVLRQLDILVNNAFFLGKNWNEDMDGLLNTHVRLTEYALELLAHSDQGRIVNITSMYGMVAPDPELYQEHPQLQSRASYNAAKAALLQLTRYWASFWGQQYLRLTVNAISPGPFPRPEILDDMFGEKLKQRTMLKRLGEPEDLAGALLLLASRAGAYITGQNLVVDGGWTAR